MRILFSILLLMPWTHIFADEPVLVQGETILFSSFVTAQGFQLPLIAQYRDLRNQSAKLLHISNKGALRAESLDQIRQILNEALRIDPSDQETLKAAAEIFDQRRLLEDAAVHLSSPCELFPNDADVSARLGNVQFFNGDYAAAENSLMHARKLKSRQKYISKELGQIFARKGDHGKALSYHEESLITRPNDAETWFLQADSANRLGDLDREMDSLEHGLKLRPDELGHRTDLVRLYIRRKEYEKALYHMQPVLDDPPSDASLLATYAEFLEQAGKNDAALVLWEEALKLDADMEAAHYGVVHILLDKSDFPGCIRAADAGITHDPLSPRLYLAKVAAQEHLGLWYDARRTLEKGSACVKDLEFLRRYAQTEEQYGWHSGHAYRMAVSACEKTKSSKECLDLMHRGFMVSLRDGDTEEAEWFARRLRSLGRNDLTMILGKREFRTTESRVRVPGGIRALLRLLADKEDVPKDEFLRNFASMVLLSSETKSRREALKDAVSRHFEIIHELEGQGRRETDKIAIALSLSEPVAARNTQKILKLLGWEIGKGFEIQPVRGTSAAKRQQTSAALALDEVAMQEALKSGRTFTFEIVEDWVPVVLGEAPWRDQIYGKRDFLGGFTEALSDDLDFARLYAGIAELDETTADQLIKDFGLKMLHDEYAELLYANSSNLIVRNAKVLVPGGAKYESVWEKMVGASPSDSRQFFRQLLRMDDGKMLEFFSCLMGLDIAHQRYFSASVSRTRRFYELFRESPEIKANNRRSTPFQDFMSQMPLDSEGHLLFPGSPEVWMVAKGQSDSAEQTARLLKKVSRIANPDVEDEILLRLARTEYSVGAEQMSQLENFLGVVRIEAHRSKPLDEASALLLAQQHAYHHAIWPYLASLTGLGIKEYEQLFRLGPKLQQLDLLILNDVLGEFNAISKLICLLQEFKRIDETQAAILFRNYCEQLGQAVSSSEFADYALGAFRNMLQAAGVRGNDYDTAIRELLINPTKQARLDPGTKARVVAAKKARLEGYQRIMEIQKVPSMNALFGIQEAAAGLTSGKGPRLDYIEQLKKHLAEIPQLDPTKWAGQGGNAKESLTRLRLTKLQELTEDLGEAALNDEPNPKKLASLSGELMGELNRQVRVALTGILYAFYFRPTDLLMSEDPSFLRRHQFVRLDSLREKTVYIPENLFPDEQAGSYLTGGFANFAKTTSMASMATFRKSQGFAIPFASAILSSLRDTDWGLIKDEDLRIVGLRVRAGREWVIRAGVDPASMSELAESIEGLLSASRRGNLLRAIRQSQWDLVWSILKTGDLFSLGEQYLLRFKPEKDDSPTIAALREFSSRSDLSNLNWLGPELNSIYECSHPHLLQLPPYEYFEDFTFPDKLAERSNQFMIYLSELFDRAGVSSMLLESFAEPLAIRLISRLQLTGIKDWRSVQRAYSNMDEKWVESGAGEE